MSQDTEEAIKKKEQEAEERRQQSHNMVADTIKRELLESTSNKATLLASHTQHVRRSQRRKKPKSLTLTIRMVSTQESTLRHGGYGSWGALSVTRRPMFRESWSGKRLNEDGRCPRNNDSKRIWKMPNALAMKSRRVSKSSYRNTGTREPSIR